MKFIALVFPLLLASVTFGLPQRRDNTKVRRDLGSAGSPSIVATGALNPTLQGLGAGLQQGAGNLNEAVQNAGVTLDQVANGLADVVANTQAGLGQTLGEAPGAEQQLIKSLDDDDSPVSAVLKALVG